MSKNQARMPCHIVLLTVAMAALPWSAHTALSHAAQCSAYLSEIDRLTAAVSDLAKVDPGDVRITNETHEVLGKLTPMWRAMTRQKVLTDIAEWKGGRLPQIWELSSQLTERAMSEIRAGHATVLPIAGMALLLQLEIVYEVICVWPDKPSHEHVDRLETITENLKKAPPLRPPLTDGPDGAESRKPPADDVIKPLMTDDSVKVVKTLEIPSYFALELMRN